MTNSNLKTTDEIHAQVRETYGQIAREGGSCCAPGGGCCRPDDASRRVGYTEQELASVPDSANLGLGCGNPQAIAALRAGERVLDLGSGGGLDAFLAARQVGPDGHVIGVDMTPEMVSKARANAAKVRVPNVEFRLGEIERLPVADASVDVVLSNCVINLSPDKRAVFREAHRVLAPGGRLAISDIVATAPMPDELRTDVQALTGCVSGAAHVDELRAILLEVGFEAVDVQVDEASRATIGDWFPATAAAQVVASASIQARKPAKACCGPECCQ